MEDRLGNEIKIGDLCVCYSNMGTGSSTYRLVQYEGKVIGFTPKFVKVKCIQCSYSERVGIEFKCYPNNVFKINYVVHGKWLDEDFPWEKATVNSCAVCSVCGEMSHKENHGYSILSKYCPNCGADMRGNKDEA